MFPEDIISILLTLISGGNWNPANTSSITPEFFAGYLSGQGGPHQVCIENTPNEDALGTSGVHGINSSGGNNQLYRGLTFIDAFAEEGDGLGDPDLLTNEFVREIQRIVRANMNSVAGYDYISFLGYNRIPPQQGVLPRTIRRSCRIGFQWRIEV